MGCFALLKLASLHVALLSFALLRLALLKRFASLGLAYLCLGLCFGGGGGGTRVDAQTKAMLGNMLAGVLYPACPIVTMSGVLNRVRTLVNKA